MAAAFERYHLEYMNVAFDQHGELRYRYARKADVVRPGRGKDPLAPFDENTPLHVASVTKVMTSVLVILTGSEANEIQRDDTNFSRLNAVMLANLADSPMGMRTLPEGAAR